MHKSAMDYKPIKLVQTAKISFYLLPHLHQFCTDQLTADALPAESLMRHTFLEENLFNRHHDNPDVKQ